MIHLAPSLPSVAATPGCLLAPVSALYPASQSLSAVFNDSVHYVLYRQYKWRGGWMLATESGDDSEKMTGLWRREVLGKERRKERARKRGGKVMRRVKEV